MRLLVVAPYPPSDDTNGLRARAWSQALLRSREDLQVRVVAGEESGAARTTPEGAAGGTEGPLTVRRAWSRRDPLRSLVRKVLAESDRFGPEVAHLHFNYLTYGNPVKSFAALRALLDGFARRRVRTVVTLHSVVSSPLRYLASRCGLDVRLPKVAERASARVSAALLERSLRGADEVVVASPGALDWLREHCSFGRSHSSYVPLGSTFPEPPAAAAGARSDGSPSVRPVPQVTCVGRLVPYKGLEDLVRAAGRLTRERRPVQLTIVGEVPGSHLSNRWYLQRLRRLVRREGAGSVALEARYVPTTEYLELQRQADVVALSFRDDGVIGSSGSVLDFGAAGRARLVLTDVPRLRGYRGVPGITYCRAGDPARLAEAIWAAAHAPPVDPAARQGELRDLTVESVSSRYAAIYLRLTESGPLPLPSGAPPPEGLPLSRSPLSPWSSGEPTALPRASEPGAPDQRPRIITVTGAEQGPR